MMMISIVMSLWKEEMLRKKRRRRIVIPLMSLVVIIVIMMTLNVSVMLKIICIVDEDIFDSFCNY